MFVVLLSGGFVFRVASRERFAATAAEPAPLVAPDDGPAAPSNSAVPSRSAWDSFEARWAETRDRKHEPTPFDPGASDTISRAVQSLRTALSMAQLLDIAIAARSRHFMSDTETLIAATRPRTGATQEQMTAASALQAQIMHLADPARPDLGLAALANDMLVGGGPSKDLVYERPNSYDIDHFEAELKRELIYTQIPLAEVLEVIQLFGVVIEERRARARAYDEHLVRAVELARVAVGETASFEARAALRARLYASLDEVVLLVIVDFAERDLILREGFFDRHGAIGSPMEATATLWSDVARLRDGWLLGQNDGRLVDRYQMLVASERSRGTPQPSLPPALRGVYEGVERDQRSWRER